VSPYSETGRQVVHVAMAAFALLLRYFTWPQAALLAFGALVFNLVVLGRIAPAIVRPAELRSVRPGILFYPLSVLVLVLAFPHRLDIVAAAWGVMAVGDGCATLAGTRLGGRPLPWNRRKTWTGLVAIIAAGATGGAALGVWVAPSIAPVPPLAFSIGAAILAAVVAAFVETLPLELDDNISVPAAAGATLWFCSTLDRPAGLESLALDLATGMVLATPLALLTLRARKVTAGAAVTGVVFAGAIYAGAYLAGLVVLAAALGLTLVSSRAARWSTTGVLAPGEVRAMGNIVANCLVGTLAAVAERLSGDWSATLTAIWLVAGIAAGASDTVASEIGRALGGTPRQFPTFRRSAPGTPGAVSVLGTLAGAIAAALIASPAAFLWLVPWEAVPVIVLACTIGAGAESALSTAFESSGMLDNNALNFLNTAIAAIVAVALYRATG
jgi:uncharacterized protein (TIGR00297 family)